VIRSAIWWRHTAINAAIWRAWLTARARKWQRSKCRGLLEDRFTNEQLRRNRYGGRVVCDDKNLLYEEAGHAYKNIDQVVQDPVDAGLIRTIAKFAPVLTYKISKRERDDE
jgi:release factor H-coupled RctB family protein